NLNSTSVNSTGLLQPANGTIVINANGTITYTPNPGYEGTDQFEYRVYSSDYPGISDVALVTVKVTDCAANATENLITGKVFVEQLPDDGVYDSSEMGAAGVQVNLYTDANCNGTIDTGDNIGQSTISDLSGNYVFHTQNGYNAKDNFATASFSGNDGGINWTTSWVEQGELSQNVSAGDVRIMADASTSASSNAIRIAGATNGISRSLTFNNATSASLRFSYRKEGINGIPPNAKTLTVTVNGTPVYTIQDGDYAGGTDPNYTEVTIPLTAFNPNSSNTVQFMSSSTLGTTEYFWIDNVELTYFKNPACYIIKVDPSNTNGAYTTSSLNSQTAQFTNIGVCEKVNNLGVLANLVASDDAANTATDIPVVINVLANDVNGKPNPATVTTTGLANQPANGTVQVNEDGTITYTPNPGFSGSDDFEYRVCSLEDPSVCDIALVTVTVSCISIANQNTITGNVYNDVNLNGALNAGETGASGVMVNLFRDTDNDGVLDTGEPLVDTKTTSTLGAYLFEITPPVTTNTYLDQFTSTSTTSSVLATQTYGTTSWTTSWTEIGVTNGFLTAPTRITSTSGLSIEGNGSTTVLGALRTANISTGIAATLSFNVAESGLDMDVNDYVDVQVSTTASGPWTLLKRYTGADGNQTGTGSFDITPYISATTTIRFVTSGVSTMVAGDIVNFDNIQISYNVPTAAKYIVQLAQPLPRGYSLTTPLPSPTGIQTASFTGSGAGDCQNNFGLTSIVAENDINQTPLNTPTSGQLLTNDEGVTSITGATIGGNAFILGTAKQVSGVDDNGNSVANAGSLTINSNGTYTFTPASGFTGTINPVTYTGTGLNGATETAILSIEVLSKLTPGNNPPVAQNDVNSTTVGITINSTVLSNDSDPNGDTITVTSASITLGSAITVAGMDIYGNAVTNAGTVTLNANGTYTYIPASGFIGTVNDITYIISDGKGGTDSAILSINVLQNDGNTIFANDDANTGIRGTTLNGNVLTNDSDPEGNTMNVTAAIANGTTINIGTATAIPNVGTLTLNNNGSYTFVPDAGYTGNVSIPYTICDNGTPTAACDQATLYLTELPTGPVADNDINQVPAGTTATGNVLTNDEYNGTATVTSAQYYNASGILTPLPVGTATPVYTSTGTFAGTMRLNSDGGYSFVPDAGFTGTVPVNYTMSDTYGSDATILTIEVIAAGSLSQNDKPIAQDDVSGTEINTQVSGNALSNDSDVDGNTLTIASATQGGTSVTMGSPTVVAGVDVAGNAVANAGSITLNANGTYTFTPTTGFTGTVNPISYTLSDGNGGNDTANIYITVYPNTGNNVFANDDANTGIVGTTLNGNVLTNDFDPESNTMTVTAATANATTINIGTATYIPNVGTLTLNGNGSYTFVPDADYTGTASIPYTICDNGTPQACDQATLYLTELPTTVKLWVGTTSTVFNTGSNWSAGVVPNQGDDIVFATAANNGGVPALNDLVIPVNDPKTIGSLTNLSEKSLIVPAGASLTVAGVVTGSETNPARIQVLAAENTPNGTLILAGQPCESTVMGTVQLYAKGKKDVETSWVDNVPGSPTFGTTLYGTYQWQHFGVPVEEVIANPTFYKSYLKKYHEDWNQKVTGTTPATTYYAKWENLVNSSMLKAFEGYEITQNVPTTYIIAGKLNYCDKTITLTRKAPLVTGSTDTNINNRYYGLGQNIFGNSYTASIDIDNLVFPPKVEPTVYLYNTGRFTDWATTEGGLNETGLSAGQYTSIPQNTAPAIFDGRIPSMNGFLLIHRGPQPYYESETDDDVTMSLPYINGLVANTRPQTVARKPLSFLKISLASKSTRDNLWLFSQEGTTDKLDDGWDGRKFFGTPTAFIYTENADGPLQVSADATIDGKVLSFYANSDTEYTLQLAKTNLEDYPNLQLIDLRSRTITPLTGDVTTYRFTADSKGLVEKRFIIANSSFIDFNSDKFKFLDGYLSNNNRLIITNFTPKSGTMHLYDISGKTLINRNITPSVNEIPVSLLSGVYILHLQADDKRETIKLIIK
ncbi:MAG: hypothetical protein H6Q19_349, partial [Bacteroidetes bacterium]|nr:hypothetical protein [Bacteroidota bacterium]